MSSKARKRHEKAQDRAAIIMERTEKKVALSKDQSRVIQSRRKVWDEVNQHIIPPNGSKVDTKQKAAHDENTDESEFDDEMGEAGVEREQQQGGIDGAGVVKPNAVEENTMGQDVDDGIL